jgi:hypothetical protein
LHHLALPYQEDRIGFRYLRKFLAADGSLTGKTERDSARQVSSLCGRGVVVLGTHPEMIKPASVTGMLEGQTALSIPGSTSTPRCRNHLADICCAPTEANRQSLLKEGIPHEHIAVTGNIVVKAVGSALPDQTYRDAAMRQLGVFENRYVRTEPLPYREFVALACGAAGSPPVSSG